MSSIHIPRPEYPRPDFQRGSFQNLNGSWEFAFDDGDLGLTQRWYEKGCFDKTITVPYAYQCELSGIHEKGFHNVVWYQKRVTIHREPGCDQVLLHFGAVDYEAKVWINGRYMGEHTGGNTPFEFDITREVTFGEENTITVRVSDDAFNLEIPRGKQFWKPESEGIFYTGTTGIWQTVWIEQVASDHLKKVWITSDIDRKTFSFKMEFAGSSEKQVRVKLSLQDYVYADDIIRIQHNRVDRTFWLDQRISLHWNHQESLVWTPENPVLFDVEFEVLVDGKPVDTVTSYCALRKVSITNGKFMLNNTPYYQKLLLDQGYWRQSLMTAPTDEDFVKDIMACKAMGFNGVRKHQKAEDPRFLYHADRLGLLVWGETSSAYIYSRQYAKSMVREWMDILERDNNHPSIVCWVPLNESWGVDCIMNNADEQAHSQSLYYLTKSMDQTRPVISNDGWNHTTSDLLTIHDYEGEYGILKERYSSVPSILDSTPGHRTLYAQGFGYHGEPIIVSEFGGIGFDVSSKEENAWGYTTAGTQSDFVEQYRAVVMAVMESQLIQGFCYTQLYDVEQEVNGLLTYDRNYKVDPKVIKEINDSLRENWDPEEQTE